MIESQSRTIDGMEFTVTPLPGKKGFETFPRVMKLLSPALEQLGEALSKDTTQTAAGLAVLAKAIASLAQTSPTELTSLLNLMMESSVVSVDGNQQRVMQAFDIVFAGKTLTAYKALAFAVEVNYRDFFAEAKVLFQKAGARAAASASLSPNTSATPGLAGASSEPAGQP